MEKKLAYHVTPLKHRKSIEEKGILVSRSGLDGPGVYAFCGPLEKAVKNADISLSDNHYQMPPQEFNDFLKTLCLFEIEYDSTAKISVEWDDYLVFTEDISPKAIRCVGVLLDLAEEVWQKSNAEKMDHQ